jgi:hypothetical protein
VIEKERQRKLEKNRDKCFKRVGGGGGGERKKKNIDNKSEKEL